AIQFKERKGIDRSEWAVIDQNIGEGNFGLAFDGQQETVWLTEDTDLPRYFAVDMGRIQPITGFSYLPPQDGSTLGLVSRYTFEISTDRIVWDELSAGEFSNIIANPITQYVPF